MAGLFHEVLDVMLLLEKRSKHMTKNIGGEMKKEKKSICPTALLKKNVNKVISTV